MRHLLLFALLTLAHLEVEAIECPKARTLPERTICSSPVLRAHDEYLNQAYDAVRAATTAESFAEVRQSQREWIRHRDSSCGASPTCMLAMTQERTAQLNDFAQRLLGGPISQEPRTRPSAPVPTPDLSRVRATLTPTEIYRLAAQSVVVVLAYNTESGQLGQGSGVVIRPDTVATNCHVIEGSTNAVILYRGQRYIVKSFRGDRGRDACIVTTDGLPATAATAAALSTVEPGQRVYSIGSPRGLELTIAEGLVSAIRSDGGQLPSIQTSAPISPGSSGGGLFDEAGRVIGITTSALRESQNLNFAIPIETLLRR
jgi:S1-C subfamily serine protease